MTGCWFQQEQNEQHSGKLPRCTPSSNPSIPSEHLHIPRTLTTRHNGVHERHGSADKRSQNQTPEEEDESDERDSHQSVRFPVRLGSCPAFSCPAISCPATWSVIFMSCNFMPCYLVRQFHVLQFHVRHFQRPRDCIIVFCRKILLTYVGYPVEKLRSVEKIKTDSNLDCSARNFIFTLYS